MVVCPDTDVWLSAAAPPKRVEVQITMPDQLNELAARATGFLNARSGILGK